MSVYEYSVRIKTTLDDSSLPEEHRRLLAKLERSSEESSQRIKKSATSAQSEASRAAEQSAPIIIRTYEREAAAAEASAAKQIAATRALTAEEIKLQEVRRRTQFQRVGVSGAELDRLGVPKIGSGLSGAAEKEAAASLQRQRAMWTTSVGDLEKGVKTSAASTARLSSETDKLIANSARAISGAESAAVRAEASIARTTASIGAAKAEASSFGGIIAGLASPVGIAVAAFTVLATVAIGAGAAAFKVSDDFAKTGRQIAFTSEQTGLSIQNVSALRVGMTLLGKDINSLSPSINLYLKNLSEAAHGNVQAAATFKRFGLDAKAGIQDPNKAIEDLIKRLGEIENPAERADAAFKLAGRGAKDLALIAAEAHGSLKELQATADRLGVAFSENDVAASKEFEKSLALLKLQIEGVGYSIAREVLPTVGNAITKIGGYLQENQEAWKAWGKSLSTSVDEGSKVLTFLDEIAAHANTAEREAEDLGVRIRQLALAEAGAPNPRASGADDFFGRLMRLSKAELGIGHEPGRLNRGEEEYVAPSDMGRVGETKPKPKPFGEIGDVAPRKARVGADPADAAIQKLNKDITTVERLTSDAMENLQRAYSLGLIGVADYAAKARRIEEKRTTDVSALLQQERDLAVGKKKDQANALAAIDDKITEEVSKNAKNRIRITEQTESDQLDMFRRIGEASLDLSVSSGKRRTDALRASAELGIKTHADAEAEIDKIERAAFLREDKWLAAQQEQYKKGSKQFQDFAIKRIKIADDEAARIEESQDRIFAALSKDARKLEELDQLLTGVERENIQRRNEINRGRIDLLGRLGGDPKYVRQLGQSQSAAEENQRYTAERQENANQRLTALAKASKNQIGMINDDFRQRDELAEQEHQLRLEEIMLEPLIRYREKLAEIAGSIGDIFGNAFSALGQKGRSFFGELKSGFSDLFRSIVRDFISSRVKQYIESLFNPTYAATRQGGQSSGGGILSTIFGGIGSIFRPQGAAGFPSTPGFNPNVGGFNLGSLFGSSGSPSGGAGGILSSILGGGSNLSAPVSASLPVTSAAQRAAMLGTVFPAGVPNLTRSLLSGFGFGLKPGSGGALSALAPLLGVSLGSSLGGSSGLGRILGGVGGGLLGVGLTAAPGFLGTGALAALFSNPFTAVAGGALLVGALVLARNSARRRDETTRNALSNDTGTAIWQLIGQAKAGTLGLNEAKAQWAQIQQKYLAGANAIKDKRTRQHALDQWSHDFMPLQKILYQAAAQADTQKAQAQLLHQTYAVSSFASGGFVGGFSDGGMMMPFRGRVPGVYNKKDDRLALLTGDEVVLTPPQWQPIRHYLKAAGVRGFEGGGAAFGAAARAAGFGGDTHVSVTIYPDKTATVELDSPLLREKIVKTVRADIRSNPADIPGDIDMSNKKTRGY
jgi:hypothetical protein